MHMSVARALGDTSIESCNLAMDAENQTLQERRSQLTTESPAQFLALVYKRMM